jgi:hypothetical protein
MKKVVLLLITMLLVLTLSACKLESSAAVTFGYKDTGDASSFSPNLQEFTIGDTMYIGIKVSIATNKKSPRDFKVEIITENIREVEITRDGGLTPDSVDDSDPGYVVMTFTMEGKKESPKEEIFTFQGVPFEEGSSTITIIIYDEDGNRVASYDDMIYFRY